MASTSRLGPVLRFPLASHCICTCMHPSPTYPTTARKYSLSLNVPLPGKWKACKNRPLQQSDLTQRRHSSRSTSRPNGKANKRIKTTMQKIVQIQPVRAIDQSAPSAERKTLVTMGEMLDDMGLIPGTLIMPKYSVLRTLPIQEQGQKEIDRLKKRFKDLFSIVWLWSMYNGLKNWKPIQRAAMLNTADTLYRDMYTALFSNDIATIESICCQGCAKDITKRIKQHAASNLHFRWRLDRILSSPRIVSHRAVEAPLEDGVGRTPLVRQAIVRMHSLQCLQATTRDQVNDVPAVKDVVEVIEYVAIQKRIYMGKEEDWKIWGTFQNETKLEDWENTMNPEVPGNSREMRIKDVGQGA